MKEPATASLYQRQSRLASTMSALPPGTQEKQRLIIEACNLMAVLLVARPVARGVADVQAQIRKARGVGIDKDRSRIPAEMLENYSAGLRDPLTFRSPEEIPLDAPLRPNKVLAIHHAEASSHADELISTLQQWPTNP